MIDWVSAILPCKHDTSRLLDGFVMSFDALGEQQWVCNKTLSVEGSYSSKIQIKSVPHTTNQIYISGNPTKFLQGHNLFGLNDLVRLMGDFFDALIEQDIGLQPTGDQYDAIQTGNYSLTRVDVNESWHLKDRLEVLAFIRALGQTANMKRRGTFQYSGDTAYIGKNSRRWSAKCYSKGTEILAKGHRLPTELNTPEMVEYANKSLRLELVLRQLELKRRGLDTASNWSEDTARMLLQSMVLDNLELSDNMTLPDDILHTLPNKLRSTYVLWKDGEDLRQTLSKPTFYRHRIQLLEFGIDISIAQESKRNNIVPMIRYLEAEPVGVPSWAYQKGLVA